MGELALTTVVWFKRDLRVEDHAPLVEATRGPRSGPVVCLYIYEPEILAADDVDGAHLSYINGSLRALQDSLRRLGAELVTRVGSAVDVLGQLHQEAPFDRLVSHQETGNYRTFQRDRAVRRWARQTQVTWTEYVQDGVVRALDTRDGWARQWDAAMRSPILPPPERVVSVSDLGSAGIVEPEAFRLEAFAHPDDSYGASAAENVLRGFLYDRGERYQAEMSSPLTAETSCSRLSAYIAYGVLSRRVIYQAFEARREEVRDGRKAKSGISADWSRAMSSFNKRLHWNGHFIQRLELQPELEFTNMSRAMDGLREDNFREDFFQAWCDGETGYPMVDACMRYLRAKKWINFRMRAMLTSFASYHLWLDWRRTGAFLARQFTDYEPGIHYSQLQMQSGTTGINAVRIYSPTKQALDHDPDGVFIRRWVPELEGVPTEHIAEPHKMTLAEQSAAGCEIGRNYPAPLVDHREAVRSAKSRIYSARSGAAARDEAKVVYERHGSRKKRERARSAAAGSAPNSD